LVAALDVSMNNGNKLYPVCSYMSEEIIGDYALSNTTIRELGLTSGTAVIR
jgi:tether containing UBX domain for GLUT4